ncbi:MAG TPA: DUF3341 domain-containing protein [Longimicrobiales bacterium]
MSTVVSSGTLGVYDALDAATTTIERLRAAGLKRITVFSPLPSHELEHALHAGESPVRLFTLVGGLTGAATGFAFATWTAMDWPLITGGKPIISIPAWVIIAFELTILFGALSTVAGLFINARLPQRRLMQVYDPTFSADRFGILVMPPSGREADVRRIMEESGAAEIREQVQEVKVGDL